MLFNSKPLLYLQILDRSIRYLAIDPTDKSIIDQDEIIFETNILEDGEVVNLSILETRLDALVKEKKWKNAKTHVLLLNNFIVLREEMIPVQLNKSEIRDYLNLHIGQSIRIPYEDPKFDFQVIEKNEEEQKIFIIAYPGDKVKGYQKMLQKVSLRPVVADIIPLSLYRLAEQQGLVEKNDKQHTLMLEWNPYETAFMVYHQDRPTFYRQTESTGLFESWEQDVKGEWLWKRSADELEMLLEDQLNALERFLDFYNYSVLNGEGSVTEIILSGYYPDLEDLKERLSARFGVSVDILELPEGIDRKFSALYGLTLKEEKHKMKKTSKKGRGGRSE